MNSIRPYKEININNKKIRKFSNTLSENSLKWHRDKNNRKITVISGKNWKIQFENKIPFEIIEGCSYNIKSKNWHRLIKGSSDLIIEIEEII
tara:strand:- start:196 stop:471 length:276 start_codon:yes stop_codon:yes gene_type:complete